MPEIPKEALLPQLLPSPSWHNESPSPAGFKHLSDTTFTLVEASCFRWVSPNPLQIHLPHLFHSLYQYSLSAPWIHFPSCSHQPSKAKTMVRNWQWIIFAFRRKCEIFSVSWISNLVLPFLCTSRLFSSYFSHLIPKLFCQTLHMHTHTHTHTLQVAVSPVFSSCGIFWIRVLNTP
jgi:hypothetical protein